MRTIAAYIQPGRAERLLVALIVEMLDHHDPTVLLLPDTRSPGLRRSDLVRQVIDRVAREAMDRGIVVHFVSAAAVKAAFGSVLNGKRATHQRIDKLLAKWFPELARWLPKDRSKAWQTERYRQPLFWAAAMWCAWRGLPKQRPGK